MDNFIVFILLALAAVIVLFLLISSASKNDKPESVKAILGKAIEFIAADWDLAVNEAKKQNKLIFLFSFSTSNDRFKKLQKETLSDIEVGNYFNNNFINVSFNTEIGFGIKLADIYNISYSPTLLIINDQGKLIAQTHGVMIPKDLIEFGKFSQALIQNYN